MLEQFRGLNMKLLYTCLCLWLVIESFALPSAMQEWDDFKLKYNKKYTSSSEDQKRMEIFMDNKKIIAAHNALYEKGLSTYTLGINIFSDMFPEEIAARNGFKEQQDISSISIDSFNIDIDSDVPDSIDWRKKGAVTPVKDQGECGSCWAFSTTGSLEGQHFLKTGKLVSLSEKNLMDCGWGYGNYGCSGGVIDRAFNYVKKNGGVDTEASYPYVAENGKCRYNPKHSGSKCTGFVDVPTGSENALKAAVGKIGPVSVAIVVVDAFHNYNSGIFYSEDCINQKLGHAVLVVGYGSENGSDYWIVKNSWGEGWGNKGYVLMARNKNNNCGIASLASYPLV